MDSNADIVCVLKVHDIHCETCKTKMMDVLRSIRGVYTVNIDAQGGRVQVVGEMDPNILLWALSRSGKHAEVVNVTMKHPQLRKSYYDDSYKYGSYYGSINNGITGHEPSYRYRSMSLPADPSYYETNQRQYPRRPCEAEYQPSYNTNYQYDPLPQATYVPSYPPQEYNPHEYEGMDFCSIM